MCARTPRKNGWEAFSRADGKWRGPNSKPGTTWLSGNQITENPGLREHHNMVYIILSREQLPPLFSVDNLLLTEQTC